MAAITTVTMRTGRRLFGLLIKRVAGDTGVVRRLVGPVLRLMPAFVMLGRRLVSTSAAMEPEASRAVPISLPEDDESFTRAVPSARQNASVSSFSTRLHAGHRFTGFSILHSRECTVIAV